MVLFVIIYLVATIIIGVLASRMVKNSEDYLLAGRRLPLYITTATLFATWFGSETILGASSEFVEGGLIAIVRDPFGAALCLLLVGLVYARPLYRMKLLTLGDFFRRRYGNLTELIASICLILSSLAWIAAQFVAFGIIANTLTGIGITNGIIIGCLLVTFYTFIGGMWSVSITDFMQLIFIVLGLVAACVEIFGIVSFGEVFANAPDGFFRFWPEGGIENHLDYFAAWITIGLGSIAGQEIFQRVMAAKSEKVAVRASVLSSIMYLTIAMLPLLLALAARTLEPSLVAETIDNQMIVPGLVGKYASPIVQVLLFGALISAILSTASSALLAPSAIFGENIVRPRLKIITDKQFLLISRLSVLLVAAIAIGMALRRGNIYELVGQAASVGLVSLFVPLTAGIFWKKANKIGAIASIFAGFSSWVIASLLNPPVEPILFGLSASIVGMVLGSNFSNSKVNLPKKETFD